MYFFRVKQSFAACFPLGWKGQEDSITFLKSSVRGARGGRLCSAAATRSSPLRLRSFGLEDSETSFFSFWHERSSFFQRPLPLLDWHTGRPYRRVLLSFPVAFLTTS